MPPRPRIRDSLRAEVRERAASMCEYCHALEAGQYVEFTMEHLVPVATGGQTVLENLALACFACNRRKWDRRTATDPHTGDEHALFSPRRDQWNDHFMWSRDGLRIVGVTAIGRATVAALEMNRDRAVAIRAVEIAMERHPPASDAREP